MKDLYYLMTSRLLWGCAWISLLCYLVWRYGGLISYNEVYPLESEVARIWICGGIVCSYLVYVAIKKIYKYWKEKKTNTKSISEQQKTDNDPKTIVTSFRRNFKEISRTLRRYYNLTVSKNTTLGKIRYLLKSRSEIYHQLPWYLIIGNEKSGKGSLIENSGLDFPLELTQYDSSLAKINNKNFFQWNFTDSAVLFELRGKLLKLDNENIKTVWSALLENIVKIRSRQPINGIILVVSFEDIMSKNEDALYENALELRDILLDIQRKMKIKFPVYTVISKMDKLYGFSDYFQGLNEKERDQIFGFTVLDYENVNGLTEQLDGSLVNLKKELGNLLPDILSQSNSYNGTARAFTFIHELDAFEERLQFFMESVFKQSAFDQTPPLQGIFFTSALQGEQFYSHLMNEIQVASGVKFELKNKDDEGVNKKYFIKSLFKQHILNESFLAEVRPWNKLLYYTVYFALIFSVLTFTVMIDNSYKKNREYINEVKQKIPLLMVEGEKIPILAFGEIQPLVLYLSEILKLPESKNYSLSNVPVTHRFGFYKGTVVTSTSTWLYDKALVDLLLPQVSQYIKYSLYQYQDYDVNEASENLKMYLMLHQPEHYNGQLLYEWVARKLKGEIQNNNLTKVQLDETLAHLKKLLVRGQLLSPYSYDESLVHDVREYINKVPMEKRVFRTMEGYFNEKYNLKSIRLIDIAGPESANVFMLTEGLKKNSIIPQLYTSDFYYRVFIRKFDVVVKNLLIEEAWVAGLPVDAELSTQIEDLIHELYARTFVKKWEDFLDSLKLRRVFTLDDKIMLSRVLSGTNSPLFRISQSFEKYISPPKERQDAEDQHAENQSLLNSFLERQNTVDVLYESTIYKRFESLIEIGRKHKDDRPQLERLSNSMQELNEQLIYLKRNGNNNPTSESNVGSVLIRVTSDAQSLPQPFSRIILDLIAGIDSQMSEFRYETIRKKLKATVSNFCMSAIANRYPITRTAKKEIKTEDFIRFFAPGKGTMDSFYKENLKPLQDAQYSALNNQSASYRRQYRKTIIPFEQAAKITNAFFDDTGNFSYHMSIKPISMDNSILSMVLNIDGQKITYSHGPVMSTDIVWPGKLKTNNVSMVLTLPKSKSISLTEEGPWALIHFFDKANIKYTDDNFRLAEFNLEGKLIKFKLSTKSINFPFNSLRFTCP